MSLQISSALVSLSVSGILFSDFSVSLALNSSTLAGLPCSGCRFRRLFLVCSRADQLEDQGNAVQRPDLGIDLDQDCRSSSMPYCDGLVMADWEDRPRITLSRPIDDLSGQWRPRTVQSWIWQTPGFMLKLAVFLFIAGLAVAIWEQAMANELPLGVTS